MNVLDAIRDRRSIRAFLPKSVDNEIIAKILETARFAPSGCNAQPWKVSVLGCEHKHQLATEILKARKTGVETTPDYQYYPSDWHEPYKSRRFSCGKALYGALDIAYHDKVARENTWERNYHFFNAPIGLIFHMDNRLGIGSYMDIGMLIQNVMLAARHFGLETCPQAALADYPDQVRNILSLEPGQIIICGMALGYPDNDAKINQFRTERISVSQFTSWYD